MEPQGTLGLHCGRCNIAMATICHSQACGPLVHSLDCTSTISICWAIACVFFGANCSQVLGHLEHCAIVPSCHRGVALRHLLGTAFWSENMCCQQYFACISNCFLSRVDVRLTGMMAMRWGVIALSPWWGVMRDGHGAMVGRDGHGVLHLNIVPCTLYATHY